MRSVIFSILVSAILFSSCSDNGCKPVSPESEEPQIVAFATANSIPAVKHSTGLYYHIVAQGSGPTPNVNSIVYVTYTGKTLDGTIFDQRTTPVAFVLRDLLEGWKIGLQLIQKGGQIRLIVPSSLAYSCYGAGGVISSNTVLYFDIQLIDVQ
jgi:FKBP-type peptidyl-prolyl cis-trans isomerase FkpA